MSCLSGLEVLKKMEELGAYSHKSAMQMPKFEKHVLCAEIRVAVADITRLIIRSAKRYYKKTTLEDLDIEIEILRCLIRRAYSLGHISCHRYEVWIRHTNEVGSMIGGWIKNVRKKEIKGDGL